MLLCIPESSINSIVNLVNEITINIAGIIYQAHFILKSFALEKLNKFGQK
jgi:hypothetical protein